MIRQYEHKKVAQKRDIASVASPHRLTHQDYVRIKKHKTGFYQPFTLLSFSYILYVYLFYFRIINELWIEKIFLNAAQTLAL